MSPAVRIVCLATLLGCSDSQVHGPTRPSPLETGIARDLTARFGTPATVSCVVVGAIPITCNAALGDGTALPIVIENAGKDAWGWRIDGVVIESKTIVAHVEGELAALGVAQGVTCGPAIQLIRPGGRVACTLAGGGAAFVQVAADGSTMLELALDAVSAAARAEPVTPAKEDDLLQRSRELGRLAGESDGEEPVADGGVPNP